MGYYVMFWDIYALFNVKINPGQEYPSISSIIIIPLWCKHSKFFPVALEHTSHWHHLLTQTTWEKGLWECLWRIAIILLTGVTHMTMCMVSLHSLGLEIRFWWWKREGALSSSMHALITLRFWYGCNLISPLKLLLLWIPHNDGLSPGTVS